MLHRSAAKNLLRTYDGDLSDIVTVSDDLREAYVRELGLAVPREQDVGALEVHVHDPLGVQEVKSSQDVDCHIFAPVSQYTS